MKNFILIAAVSIVTAIAICSNLSSCSSAISKTSISADDSVRVLMVKKHVTRRISPAEASLFVGQFAATNRVTIPTAWIFQTDHLLALIGETSPRPAFIKFYAAERGTDSLTLVAVGADADTVNIESAYYEFAAPCPPYCSRNQRMLDIVSGCKFREFRTCNN